MWIYLSGQRNTFKTKLFFSDISRGEVINVLPFTNTAITFSLLGKYLLEAFKNCMSMSWVSKPFQGPWMPQVSGKHIVPISF